MSYKTILKKVFSIFVIIIVCIISAKLFMFYIPFLIAYIISLLVEPIIKFINRKTNLSRKASSVIALITVWGTFILVSESTNLLGALNSYLEKGMEWVNFIFKSIDMTNLNISGDIKQALETSFTDVLNNIMNGLKNVLTGFLEGLKSIPTILIYSIITILATYFIT